MPKHRALSGDSVIDLTGSPSRATRSVAIGAPGDRTLLAATATDDSAPDRTDLEQDRARYAIDGDRRELMGQLAAVADLLRQEIQPIIAQQLTGIDLVVAAVDRLAERENADRRTLRAVIEGLDRLANQIARLH